MLTPPEVLLQTLQDLGAEDFKEFKWYLWQKGALEDFPSIPKCELENTDRMDTVDEIISANTVNTLSWRHLYLPWVSATLHLVKIWAIVPLCLHSRSSLKPHLWRFVGNGRVS
uniref:Pyrin domain-containing protein n=1 Tax=Stegastes partitus TaxID=144197 RepID=A0A3B5AXG7_9TELE